MDQSIAADT